MSDTSRWNRRPVGRISTASRSWKLGTFVCGLAAALALAAVAGASTVGGSQNVPKDPAVAAMVPESVRKSQPITVPTDSDYPPLEFLAADGHTITGLSADLMHAIMATLGLKYHVAIVSFDSIVPGFAAGRYKVSLAALNVTSDRAKVVDFVTYDRGGDQFLQSAGKNLHLAPSYSSICGHTLAVLQGSTQATAAQKAASSCKKHANIRTFSTQNAVNLALKAGRADVALASNVVVGYLIKQTKGSFKTASPAFNFTSLAGFAVAKKSGLSKPVHAALQHLIASGVYHKLFAKWGQTTAEVKVSKLVTH
jgi:polar amino acid transport system substrate-binding protein